MKNIIYLGIALILTVSVSSCGSVSAIQKSENEVAGYTLKNKKELMQQKVLNKKVKTIIALP
ncbi:MAG: molybdate-binding protein [Ulvibacter sp.]|jgi:molybdate-binding protein